MQKVGNKLFNMALCIFPIKRFFSTVRLYSAQSYLEVYSYVITFHRLFCFVNIFSKVFFVLACYSTLVLDCNFFLTKKKYLLARRNCIVTFFIVLISNSVSFIINTASIITITTVEVSIITVCTVGVL